MEKPFHIDRIKSKICGYKSLNGRKIKQKRHISCPKYEVVTMLPSYHGFVYKRN